MWIERLRALSDELTFHDPAAVYYLDEAESKLGLKLPDELRELLRESNGVEGRYGLGLTWPLEQVISTNLNFRLSEDFRNLYMPFDHLLFFGDAGNGDQFAYPIRGNGVIDGPDIFVWNHENDSRSWVAPSLRLYFEWWITGRIQL